MVEYSFYSAPVGDELRAQNIGEGGYIYTTQATLCILCIRGVNGGIEREREETEEERLSGADSRSLRAAEYLRNGSEKTRGVERAR